MTWQTFRQQHWAMLDDNSEPSQPSKMPYNSLVILINLLQLRLLCIRWLISITILSVTFGPERVVDIVALLTLPAPLWHFWLGCFCSSYTLRSRLWSVALPHITDCSEREIHIFTLGTGPIVIMSSIFSLRYIIWSKTWSWPHLSRRKRQAQAVSLHQRWNTIHSTISHHRPAWVRSCIG